MRQAVSFLKTTLIGGLVVVLPIWLVGFVLIRGLGQIKSAIEPLTDNVTNAVAPPIAIAALVLLFSCFAIGLLIQTASGGRCVGTVERQLAERLPGYGLFRGLTLGVTGGGADHAMKSALVGSDDNLAFGIIIERANGFSTIFIPSAPSATSGSVHIMPDSNVHPLDIPLRKVLSSMSHYGEGAISLAGAALGKPVSIDR
ncbi:hypothetical protein EOA13_15755 [Mesorhizobium sp. M7A.F.Ca.US.011.01.1.1]|uniref:hypothetical protein n=1 Tax=Mesorhizobium sp. M7A.F.Ca.US.011.01.1.1 TaxID=2496741 RepID=UPI000FCCC2D5|nr:hypothetical protein [Mesorhizobium sp. M7A.F.Ca.US.011.01.1.1]RUX28848.1 hypothetical protein EOA13_15755 [Mesorhizobium sp. M7A.F.Ca.US.011.01.1.1]